VTPSFESVIKGCGWARKYRLAFDFGGGFAFEAFRRWRFRYDARYARCY